MSSAMPYTPVYPSAPTGMQSGYSLVGFVAFHIYQPCLVAVLGLCFMFINLVSQEH